MIAKIPFWVFCISYNKSRVFPLYRRMTSAPPFLLLSFLLALVAALAYLFVGLHTMTIDVGSQAPDVELLDAKGNPLKLSDYKGKKNVVLFFYPKSFTMGCTRENQYFAENYAQFTELNTEVIGVSKDEVDTQDKFACEYKLPFPLLSDKESKAAKAFELGHDFFGLAPARTTYVIDKEGKIVLKHNSGLKFYSHFEESLKAVKQLEGK